jgi:hypothetical protein
LGERIKPGPDMGDAVVCTQYHETEARCVFCGVSSAPRPPASPVQCGVCPEVDDDEAAALDAAIGLGAAGVECRGLYGGPPQLVPLLKSARRRLLKNLIRRHVYNGPAIFELSSTGARPDA